MFDDPFYGNQYSSLSQKQKQQVICSHDGMMLLVWSQNGPGRHNLRVFCVLTYSRTWIIHHLGCKWVGEKAMPVNSIDLKRRVWTKWNVWLIYIYIYIILNEYLSECIVWFKNTIFVKNIWKFLIRHKCKVISFSHCKGNKNPHDNWIRFNIKYISFASKIT